MASENSKKLYNHGVKMLDFLQPTQKTNPALRQRLFAVQDTEEKKVAIINAIINRNSRGIPDHFKVTPAAQAQIKRNSLLMKQLFGGE